MKPYLLFLLLLIPGITLFGQQEAQTTDGKRVLLRPDGTWKLLPEKKPEKILFPELPKPKPGDILLHHSGYSVSVNPTFRVANWVAYELTAAETVPVVKRTDHFMPDPDLKGVPMANADYKGSGYDKGHLAPAADLCYSNKSMVESFYLSNMAPQDPSFNRGIWAKLEKQVRQWAKDNQAVYVVTGTVLNPGLATIGSNKITVPRYFYKVILDDKEPDIKAIGFLMPNSGSDEPLDHFAVTVDSIEKVTGIDFFFQFSEDRQKVFESVITVGAWSWTSIKSSNDKEKSSSSTRCKGKTKAGAQCKNNTLNANGFCHLHQNQAGGTVPSEKVSPSPESKRSVSVRCSATTKKGSRCSRMTLSPNGRCWQHGGN